MRTDKLFLYYHTTFVLLQQKNPDICPDHMDLVTFTLNLISLSTV